MPEREVNTPVHIRECECGSGRALEVDDGISVRYTCTSCDTLLGDVIIGAEP